MSPRSIATNSPRVGCASVLRSTASGDSPTTCSGVPLSRLYRNSNPRRSSVSIRLAFAAKVDPLRTPAVLVEMQHPQRDELVQIERNVVAGWNVLDGAQQGPVVSLADGVHQRAAVLVEVLEVDGEHEQSALGCHGHTSTAARHRLRGQGNRPRPVRLAARAIPISQEPGSKTAVAGDGQAER